MGGFAGFGPENARARKANKRSVFELRAQLVALHRIDLVLEGIRNHCGRTGHTVFLSDSKLHEIFSRVARKMGWIGCQYKMEGKKVPSVNAYLKKKGRGKSVTFVLSHVTEKGIWKSVTSSEKRRLMRATLEVCRDLCSHLRW